MLFAKAFIGLASHRERRRDKRQLSPTLEISFEGRAYRTADWSLGGVLVSDYFGPLGPGDEVEGSLQPVTDTNNHPFKAVVVRRDSSSGELALNFTKLNDTAFSLLEAIKMDQHGI